MSRAEVAELPVWEFEALLQTGLASLGLDERSKRRRDIEQRAAQMGETPENFAFLMGEEY